MKVYKHVSNTDKIKRLLIQGKSDTPNWFEINIDYTTNRFECQTRIYDELPAEWNKTRGYSFPSSIFYEFVKEAKFINE